MSHLIGKYRPRKCANVFKFWTNCISVSGIKLSKNDDDRFRLSKNDDDDHFKLSKNDHFRSGSRPSASTSAEPDIKIVATVPGQVGLDDHHGHSWSC